MDLELDRNESARFRSKIEDIIEANEPQIGDSEAPSGAVLNINEGKSSELIESDSLRVKTSLRMHYEAQVNVIRGQIGDLELVRHKLGLSGRKMAQLLMVDPSAWTRWTKNGDEAPPHIWRALQWYLTIQQQIPGLTPHYFIARDQGAINLEAIRRIDEIKNDIEVRDESLTHLNERNQELEAKIIELENAVKANRMTALILGLAAMIMGLAFYKMLKG